MQKQAQYQTNLVETIPFPENSLKFDKQHFKSLTTQESIFVIIKTHK